jgi:hypothetical protein
MEQKPIYRVPDHCVPRGDIHGSPRARYLPEAGSGHRSAVEGRARVSCQCQGGHGIPIASRHARVFRFHFSAAPGPSCEAALCGGAGRAGTGDTCERSAVKRYGFTAYSPSFHLFALGATQTADHARGPGRFLTPIPTYEETTALTRWTFSFSRFRFSVLHIAVPSANRDTDHS